MKRSVHLLPLAICSYGYALEDADKEGTIQLFAHLSESSAAGVTQLQRHVQVLQEELGQLRANKDQEIAELQQQLQKLQQAVEALREK